MVKKKKEKAKVTTRTKKLEFHVFGDKFPVVVMLNISNITA